MKKRTGCGAGNDKRGDQKERLSPVKRPERSLCSMMADLWDYTELKSAKDLY
jgi:hypothetical protein